MKLKGPSEDVGMEAQKGTEGEATDSVQRAKQSSSGDDIWVRI